MNHIISIASWQHASNKARTTLGELSLVVSPLRNHQMIQQKIIIGNLHFDISSCVFRSNFGPSTIAKYCDPQ